MYNKILLFFTILVLKGFCGYGQVDCSTPNIYSESDSVRIGTRAYLEAKGCNGLVLWYTINPDKGGKPIEIGSKLTYEVPSNTKGSFLQFYAICQQAACTSKVAVYYLKLYGNLADKETQSLNSGQNSSPESIPPSPNAASLGKYAEIPVSTYGGLIGTNIDLYEVSNQDLKVPINLSYHHGGIRVEEDASSVGLGWTLNAGGAITRTIKGHDDLNENWGYAFNVFPQNFTFGNTTDPAVLAYYQKYRQYQLDLDTQPDLFYYNIGGLSGKFVLKANSPNTFPLEGIPLDKSNVKIWCYKLSDKNYEWKITAENGVVYTFREQEVTATASSTQNNPQSHMSSLQYFGFNYNFTSMTKQVSAWYISSIQSVKTGSVINFEYYQDRIYTSTSRIMFSEMYKSMSDACASTTTGCNSSCSAAIGSNTADIVSSTVNAMQNKYLKSIVFNNGRVDFITEQREDIQPLRPSDSRVVLNKLA